MCIGTQFDPLFFALPLLERSSRSFSPLQTILAGDLDVNLLRNLLSLLTPERLAKVCDLNGMANAAAQNFYRMLTLLLRLSNHDFAMLLR